MSNYFRQIEFTFDDTEVVMQSSGFPDPTAVFNHYVMSEMPSGVMRFDMLVDTTNLLTFGYMIKSIFEMLVGKGYMYGIDEGEFLFEIDLHCRNLRDPPLSVLHRGHE